MKFIAKSYNFHFMSTQFSPTGAHKAYSANTKQINLSKKPKQRLKIKDGVTYGYH